MNTRRHHSQILSTALTALGAVAASIVLGLNLAAEADLARHDVLQQQLVKQAVHAAAEAQPQPVELSEWALARL
jgi:hypothetical protein